MPPFLQNNQNLILIYLQILITRSKIYFQLVLPRILDNIALKFVDNVNKNIKDLKNMSGTDNVPIKNHGLPLEAYNTENLIKNSLTNS